MSKRIDLTGQRFGALVAIEPVSGADRVYGRSTWRCKCDCGKECLVPTAYLVRGIRTSCGCRAGVVAKRKGVPLKGYEYKDYTGVRFGELTGIRRIGQDRWLWECSCGRRKSIRPSLVQAGEILSCGHVLSDTARKKATEDNVFRLADGTHLTLIRGIVRGKVRTTNSSGVTGVRVVQTAHGTRYRARIECQGKTISLGTYDTLEAAAKARKDAEEKYFGRLLDEHGMSRENKEE